MSILRRYARPVGLGLVVAGVMFGVYLFTITAPRMRSFGFDAFAYWNVTLPDPYTIQYGAIGSYNYSPPFAQVADFFSAFQWNDFVFVWTMLLIGSVIWIAGSPGWILVAFATPFVAIELYHGNVHILMAVAILLGFKHPWTWALVLLTKPSSGVGLLWFVVRGEWRPFFIAIGTAGAISAVSFVFDPQLWFGWVDVGHSITWDASH